MHKFRHKNCRPRSRSINLTLSTHIYFNARGNKDKNISFLFSSRRFSCKKFAHFLGKIYWILKRARKKKRRVFLSPKFSLKIHEIVLSLRWHQVGQGNEIPANFNYRTQEQKKLSTKADRGWILNICGGCYLILLLYSLEQPFVHCFCRFFPGRRQKCLTKATRTYRKGKMFKNIIYCFIQSFTV